MRKKNNKTRKFIMLKKQIAFVLLIIFAININVSRVYAEGLASGAMAEGTPAPQTTTPDPTPTPTPTPEPTPEPEPTPTPTPEPPAKQTVFYNTIEYYRYIEGNVYENMGYELGKNGEDSKQALKNIKGIRVQLMSGDQVVAETRTDDNGNYKLEAGAGTYTVRFIYGDTDGADYSNKDEIKNILKYNGQDYMATSFDQSTNVNVEEEEVKLNGKSAIQMFLAIDCSYSARTTKVTLEGGNVKTRLEIETDATAQLIKSLLDSDENIYIGLIFFTGESYRAVSLTRNEAKLNEALNEIKNNSWSVPNTDIACALDKAKDSFYNNDKENSNRVIALISDCIPTKYGDTKVYSNESEQDVLYKLYNVIGPSTKQKLEDLKNDGIKIMTLAVETNDEETNNYVKNIFENTSDLFVKSNDGYQMVQAITQLLRKQLSEIETTVKEYMSEDVWNSFSVDDKNRREEVNNNFRTLFYQNTSLFKVIDEYNGSDTSRQQAKELSDATKMYVLHGEYILEDEKPEDTIVTQEWDGSDVITYYTTYEPIGYTLNLGLTQRPAADIDVKTTISGLQVTLANGQTLGVDTREMGSDIPIVNYTDDELVQGSKVEVEYQIQISNNSSIQYDYMALINYLPYDFKYVADGQLLTESGDNKSYWSNGVVSLDEFNNKELISDNSLNKYNNRQTVVTILDNNGNGKDGFYLPPGGKINLKIVGSRLISNLNDISDLYENENITEVLGYSNISSRRMIKYKSNNNYALYPGDTKDTDCSLEATNDAYILPPTGSAILRNKNLIIAITALFGIMIIITVMFKKNKKC